MVAMGISQSYCTGNWFGYLSNPLISYISRSLFDNDYKRECCEYFILRL